MTIRVVCFVAALFVSGPTRWVLFSLAVVLPYIAVVKANLGRASNSNMDNPMEYLQLEAEHRAQQEAETAHLADATQTTFTQDHDPATDPATGQDQRFTQHDDPTPDTQEPHNG